MKTVKSFWDYEDMALRCSTDGSLPYGRWNAYNIFRGKLTNIPYSNAGNVDLKKTHVLLYGTYSDHPVTVEDLSTLRVNGLVKFEVYPSDEMLGKKKPWSDVASEVEEKPVATVPEKKAPDARQAAIELSEQAAHYEVTDSAQYEHGAAILKELKIMQAEIGKTFDPIVEKAHQAHREAIAQRAKYLDPLKDGEKRVKAAMADWTRREQARIMAERKAAEEAAALERAALEAAKKQSYEDALKAGDLQAAREISTIDVVAEVKVVEPVQTKVSGISTRKVYKAEVIDLEALVKAASETPQFLAFLMPNESALNAFARAAKTTNCAIPGVRFVEEVVVGVRA